MGNPAALRYEVKFDDIVEFNKHHMRSSGIGRDGTRMVVIILSFLMLFALIPKAGSPDFWSLLVVDVLTVILSICLYILFRNWFLKRTVRRIYGKRAHPGLIGSHKITVSDQGVVEESEVGEHRVNWNGITRIESSDMYTFIYIGPAMAHVIPKSAIEEGDYDVFVAQAREWFEQKRPALNV